MKYDHNFKEVNMLKNSSDRYANTKLRYYAGRSAAISVICFIICLLIIPTVAQEIYTHPYENNNSFETANIIEPGKEPQTHTFHKPEDEDWVKFKAVQGETYTIEAIYDNTLEYNIMLELYESMKENADGVISESPLPVWVPAWDVSNRFGVSKLIWYSKTGGDYYVRAYPFSFINDTEYSLKYSLQVKTARYQPDDYEIYGDDNSDTPMLISINDTPQEHNFHYPGDVDWFKIKAGEDIYSVEVNTTAAFEIQVYSGNNWLSETNRDLSLNQMGEPTGILQICWIPSSYQESDFYYIKISDPYFFEGNMEYDIKVSNTVLCSDFYEKTGDDSNINATEIKLFDISRGHNLHNSEDMDWFMFQGIAGMTYTIEALTGDCNVSVEVYKFDVNGVLNSLENAKINSYTLSASEDTQYYIKISRGTAVQPCENDVYDLSLKRLEPDAQVPVNSDDYESDNSYDDATPISTCEYMFQRHNFHNSEDVDWLKFEATPGVMYSFQAINLGPNCDIGFRLYDADAKKVLMDIGSTDNNSLELEWTCPDNDVSVNDYTRYIELSCLNSQDDGVGTEYDFYMSAYGPEPCENDSHIEAEIIDMTTTGQVYEGYGTFDELGDEDWLRINETSDDYYYMITMTELGENSEVKFEVYHAEVYITDVSIPIASIDIENELRSDSFTFVPPESGDYYVKITNSNSEYTSKTEYKYQVKKVSRSSLPHGYIKGRVTRSSAEGTDEGIAGALIRTSAGVEATTTSNGYYTMNHAAGSYTVTVEAECYETYNDTVWVDGNYATTEKNIVLNRICLENPSFSPDPDKAYYKGQYVEITCKNNSDAKILYTTGNSEPDIEYTEPITVSSNTTIRAKASKENWKPSEIKVTYYFKVLAPVFSPAPDIYTEAQRVELSCSTDGAVIRYTTDRTEPAETSTVYSAPIPVSSSMTVKAKAFKKGWLSSTTATGEYTVIQTVAAPDFFPGSGTYTEAQSIVLSCSTDDAVIRYTTDKSEPVETSTIYSTPIPVNSSMTVKAKAFKTGWLASNTVAGKYTITGKVATPAFSPDPGIYSTDQNVVLSCSTPGAVIRYTTNESDPTENSPVYSTPIPASSDITIKAKAFKTGWIESDPATGKYIITGTVPIPVFSPVPGIYPTAQSVRLSCSMPDAAIHYTTDDSEPTTNSLVYHKPVSVLSSMTIKAKAFKTDWLASNTVAGKYEITGRVASPAFSPDPGIYPTNQSVALSCSTPEAVIRYTTNGSDPSESSPVYSEALSVSSSMTLRAKAFKEDWLASDTVTGEYTITGTVAVPIFSPEPGIYTAAQSVGLSCSTLGAVIRYTTDSSEPTENSPVYSEAVPVSSSMTLRAKAFKEDWLASDTVTGEYIITGTVAVPVFSPDPGIYPTAQSVELSSSTLGAVIHYTTDSSAPSENSEVYSKAVPVPYSMTVKAKAFKKDWNASNTASGNYTISGTVAAPAFSPAPGTYSTSQHVELSCYTSGALIRFTTDGSEPTKYSPVYAAPILVSSTTMIKAKAFKEDWTASPAVTGSFIITGTVAIPSFSPEPGAYTSARDVELLCPTPGAGVHFTTDGTEPSENSPVYTMPVHVPSTATIKAKAFKSGWTASATATGTYTIIGTVENPVFSPDPGVYASPQNVEISCSTLGAAIHYTTDGSEPDTGSRVFSSPIPVSETTIIKAKAFKPEWYPSGVTTEIYTITGAVKTPTFSPAPDTYKTKQDIELSCATPGAYIYYTTDGTEPTEYSSLYANPVTVSSTTTIKAKAYKADWIPSPAATGFYTITGTVATPSFWPDPKSYIDPQDVALSCSTPDATIHYTTDGSEPSENSPVYSPYVYVDMTMTIKAKAFKDGWSESGTATGAYTIGAQVETPTFSLSSGVYTSAENVELSCSAPESVIRYTTDKSEPLEDSPVYSSPVYVDRTMTIRAKAFKDGWKPSGTATESYIISLIEGSESGGACFINTLSGQDK